MLTIAISGAGLKQDAGNDALGLTGLAHHLRLVSTKTKTGVNEQPFGYAEIFRGAWNRATWAMEAVEGASFGLGIENGLEDRGVVIPDLGVELVSDYFDYAVTILRERGTTAYTVGISQGVRCPSKYVELSRASGWTKTAGAFYAEDVPGVDGADWHAHETGGLLTRKMILTPPCVDIFSRRFVVTKFFA